MFILVFSKYKKEGIICVGEKMKKIIIIFIMLVVLLFFSIFYLTNSNDNYLKGLELEIKKEYKIKDEIKYLNKFDLYYIIVTTKNLIVLNDEYKEVFKDKIKNIDNLDLNKEIVYRLNQVMYEKKKISKNKITYTYYDIYTDELIDTLVIGG